MNDRKPDEKRDVQSDRPYYEEASVPGDNEVKTALDPELEEKAQR
ncbi:MAG TPA: hypothetical protein VFN49_10580 [Candidatus Aquilonibacter sp.]|nr:hypothetical protein [Candidatus Aquilonibacter sp.]